MRSIAVVVLTLVAGCSSASKSVEPLNEPALALFASLPSDARQVAERATLCAYFASEIAGDRSERDQEVQSRMAELGCGTIEQDLGAVRGKYARNRAVLEALAPLAGW